MQKITIKNIKQIIESLKDDEIVSLEGTKLNLGSTQLDLFNVSNHSENYPFNKWGLTREFVMASEIINSDDQVNNYKYTCLTCSCGGSAESCAEDESGNFSKFYMLDNGQVFRQIVKK